jgi:hypothetical protein
MMTVEAIAYMVAEGIAANWKGQPIPSGSEQAQDALCDRLLMAANATTGCSCGSVHSSHKESKAPHACKPLPFVEISYDD